MYTKYLDTSCDTAKSTGEHHGTDEYFFGVDTNIICMIRVCTYCTDHADYVGINSKKVFIGSMMLSGALCGIAGCIEVLGVHGYFLNNFAAGLGGNGMLASLIVKNNVAGAPFMAFFLSVLKAGAMGMQQSTGVPKALVDTITAVFIIIATMETLIQFKEKAKKKETEKKEA